uniref:Uncharacterized protein n=1 Tax=Chaetoceros debilis TaxID=122233 RepID=A0A7S3QD24_9STRA
MFSKMALCANLVMAMSHQVSSFVVSRPGTSALLSVANKAANKGAISSMARYMSSSSSSSSSSSNTSTSGISRLDTLHTLLNKVGAPGSVGCNAPNDLEANTNFNAALHPHLVPIAQSKSNPDHFICALRRCYADDAMYESSTKAPWPIVEATLNGPGYKLLSLNSEQLMRRIAAMTDHEEKDGSISEEEEEIINLYNDGIGEGKGVVDAAFDDKYNMGDVSKLGYGASKYILLRVGPFPDLYEEMAFSHQARGDQSSSLIAAEAANGKFTGFASTFKFYAALLSTYDNREDETRDAARVCLRMALPSIGASTDDFDEVAQLARLSEEGDDHATAMQKMEAMYEKIKKHEEEDEQNKANMTPEQVAIEAANEILDRMVFVADEDRDWSSVRAQLSGIYANAGIDDMAEFVNPPSE